MAQARDGRLGETEVGDFVMKAWTKAINVGLLANSTTAATTLDRALL
jgi:hypothetical protein